MGLPVWRDAGTTFLCTHQYKDPVSIDIKRGWARTLLGFLPETSLMAASDNPTNTAF